MIKIINAWIEDLMQLLFPSDPEKADGDEVGKGSALINFVALILILFTIIMLALSSP